MITPLARIADANLMRCVTAAVHPVLKTYELIEIDGVDGKVAFHLVSPLFR